MRLAPGRVSGRVAPDSMDSLNFILGLHMKLGVQIPEACSPDGAQRNPGIAGTPDSGAMRLHPGYFPVSGSPPETGVSCQ